MSGNRCFSGNNQSQFGFSYPNNQGGYGSNQSATPWVQNPNTDGFNHNTNFGRGSYPNSNIGNNSNNASFDNYYGMGNFSNRNSNYNETMPSGNVPSGFTGGNFGNTGPVQVSGFPPFVGVKKGGKKKGFKRPLPEDPKEKRRIKRNNRSNKISSKAGMGGLPSVKVLRKLAAKHAPEGLDVMKVGRKKLKTLAAPELFSQGKIEIHDIPKTALVKIAAKHISDRVNVASFSKKALKNLIKRIDPTYVPPEPVDPNKPLSKKARRKKKAQDDEFARFISTQNKGINTLSNPIKIIHTPFLRKQVLEPRTKRKPGGVMEVRKFTPNSIVQRYTELQSNKVLDYNGLTVVGFLRFVLFQVYPNQRAHCSQFSKYVLKHHNVLKLLQYEVKKLLDQRFGENNRLSEIKNNKRNFLKLHKEEVMADDVHFFKDDQAIKRSNLVDECIDTLTADDYPSELVPTPCEFLKDPNKFPSHAESTRDFKHLFITHMYEGLGYEITSNLSVEDKIKFHLENPIIAAILFEFVLSYDTYVVINPSCMFKVKPGDQMALPPMLKNHLKRTASIGYMRSPALGKIYELLIERNAQVHTKILQVLPEGAKPSTSVLRDFANFIVFADEIISIVKYKLMEHTPFLPLLTHEKLDLFNNMVKKIYREGLEILKNKVSIHDITFNEINVLNEKTTADIKEDTN